MNRQQQNTFLNLVENPMETKPEELCKGMKNECTNSRSQVSVSEGAVWELCVFTLGIWVNSISVDPSSLRLIPAPPKACNSVIS